MGWAVGEGKDGRDIGYGVPALCDHPACGKEIHRGLAYICGIINTEGEDRGCGLHFCGDHRRYSERFGQLCFRCWPRRREPFIRKPDVREWIEHKLTDESWQDWRDENASEVSRLKAQLATTPQEQR